MIQLKLNNTTLALTQGSFKEAKKNVDRVNTSEGGHTLRAVTRTGIPTLNCSYKCDGLEKARLDDFAEASSLTATIFSERLQATTTWLCYMDGYSADLIIENGNERFYKVSFTLNDLS